MRTSEVSVGLAGPGAAAGIAAVKVAGWRTTYAAWMPSEALEPFLAEARATEALERVLREEPNFCVATRARSEVVGFALCVPSGQPEPLLDSFHVLPDARRAGIGTMLLRELAVELDRRSEVTLAVAVVGSAIASLQPIWTSSPSRSPRRISWR